MRLSLFSRASEPSPAASMAFRWFVLPALLASISAGWAPNPTPAPESHCHFPAIFNFGDSNSDTGGLSAAFGQVPPPHGESFFGGPAGRYCDGRLTIDFIAERLGLPYLSPYLDAVGANFTHGANFATAASTIRTQNTSNGYSPFSLNIQSIQFHEFRTRSLLFASKENSTHFTRLPGAEAFSRALYTFDIGQNDLTAGYDLNMTSEEVVATVPDMLDQFSAVVKSIYGQGGRSFWVHNTGPVGCLPYVMDDGLNITAYRDAAGCAGEFNDAAKHFNRLLKEAVVRLRRDLPLAVITYVDVYSVKYSLFTDAKKHGFEEPLRACCGYGGKYNYNRNFRCGATAKVRGKEVLVGKPCRNPAVRVCWDGVHYTQAANRWIFSRIIDGSYSDPPVPLSMACHRH